MKHIYTFGIILMLIVGTASAAVYHITTNPEARLYFGLDHEVVNPMQNTFWHEGIYTNSLDIGNISSELELVKDIRHENTGKDVYFARIFIIIECDTGISIASHTSLGEIIYDGIEDFTHITYEHPDHTVIECNNMSYVEILSDTKVKITPRPGVTEFSGDRSRFSLLSIGFNPMAHGNYIITVNTE